MTDKYCRLPRSHYSAHLDGEPIPLRARFMVWLHLRICAPCKRYHRSLVATRDALSELRDKDPP
jgi:hypothetical protein